MEHTRDCVRGIVLLSPLTRTTANSWLSFRKLNLGYAIWPSIQSVEAAIAQAVADPQCVMVNRNRGSGTRILIDRLLQGATPPGYALQPRNHNAVAAAVAQGRADWGLAVESVARQAGLGFLPVTEEQYDFVVPVSRSQRPAIDVFRRLLADPHIRANLTELGCR